MLTRVIALSCLTFGLSVALTGNAAAQTHPKINFSLDWKIQGLHAWYYLAQERGYFKQEGLDVAIDQGEGSSATITRIVGGAYQAGMGDINTAIQVAAEKPSEAPVCVYMFYNRPPFVLVSHSPNGIKTLQDAVGKTIGAPANSAAFLIFPVLAKKNGIDPNSVKWQHFAPNLQEQMLVRRQVDAIAAFNVTSYSNLAALKTNPDSDFTWLFYSNFGLDLYSNCVMVSRKLLASDPAAVGGLVRAVHHGLTDTVANLDAAMDAVMKHDATLDRVLERDRLAYALRTLVLTPEAASIGVGDVDDERLKRATAELAEAFKLPRQPAPSEVFNRQFLPPKAERMLKM